MFSRMVDWAFGLVFAAVSQRIAEQVSTATGTEIEPLTMDEPKQLAAPKKR